MHSIFWFSEGDFGTTARGNFGTTSSRFSVGGGGGPGTCIDSTTVAGTDVCVIGGVVFRFFWEGCESDGCVLFREDEEIGTLSDCGGGSDIDLVADCLKFALETDIEGLNIEGC